MPLTNDPAIAARLSEIGSYEDGGEECRWESPAALENDFTPLELIFCWDGSAIDGRLIQLLDRWDAFLRRFPQYVPKFRQHIVSLFRDVYQEQMSEDELEEMIDDEGELSDESILAKVDGGSIELQLFGDSVRLTAHFGVDWDMEHGVEVEFTDTGELIKGWKR